MANQGNNNRYSNVRSGGNSRQANGPTINIYNYFGTGSQVHNDNSNNINQQQPVAQQPVPQPGYYQLPQSPPYGVYQSDGSNVASPSQSSEGADFASSPESGPWDAVVGPRSTSTQRVLPTPEFIQECKDGRYIYFLDGRINGRNVLAAQVINRHIRHMAGRNAQCQPRTYRNREGWIIYGSYLRAQDIEQLFDESLDYMKQYRRDRHVYDTPG